MREVDLNDVKDLSPVGNPNTSTVHKGTYEGKTIAVKVVNGEKETNVVRQLRLNHPNLLKFMLVVCIIALYNFLSARI